MARYYCTYFDRNYLAKGLALLESLQHWEESSFHVYVICLDEISRAVLFKLKIQNITIIAFHEVEHNDMPLQDAKKNRSLVEYYWTCTPTIIKWVLEKYPSIDALTYVDSDLFFYSSPAPIFDEFNQASVLIHEHRFSRGLVKLEVQSGKYNVGLLGFRNNLEGMRVLQWWRERCLEWCYEQYSDGKMGDQMYLNDWPQRFSGVKVLQHIGAGVAPWNHEQYNIRRNDHGTVELNKKYPLIFFHFHALVMVNNNIIIPNKHSHYPITREVLEYCYVEYASALKFMSAKIKNILPEFNFGIENLDIPLGQQAFLGSAELQLDLKNLPIQLIPMNKDWICYTAVDLDTAQESNWFDEQNELAEKAFSENNFSLAESLLFDVLKKQPIHSRTLNNLGVISLVSGKNEMALRYFFEAVKADPYDRNALMNCGDLLPDFGLYNDLFAMVYCFLDEHPDDLEMTNYLIDKENKYLQHFFLKCDVSALGYVSRNYRLSVLVSTYNSEEFMQECLENLIAQSIFDQIEIIIVDAHSNQNEKSIVLAYQKRYSNIKYLRTPERIGIYPAWNLAIHVASANYLTPFSTNDVLNPKAYEILCEALDNNSEVMLIYGDSYLTDNPHEKFGQHKPSHEYNGAFVWPEYKYEDMLLSCLVGPHPIWRKTLHAHIGYFDGRYKAIGDQDFWLRIGWHYPLRHIPIFTGLVWLSKESLSGEQNAADEIKAIHSKYIEAYKNNAVVKLL